MQLLKNKTSIVTGATAGIGREIALQFAKHGADVIVIGTNQERAESVVKELNQAKISDSQRFCYKIVNVASTNETQEAMNQILTEFGKVDILVNNAGITRDGLLMKMKEEDWDTVIDVNLKSAFNTCQSLIRAMMKARSGKIINISSVVGLTGNAGQVNYSASKAGIIGFTKALALEVATRGICVNCIAPGFIQTRMTDELSDTQKQAILAKIPMGNMGTTQNIADAAVFLASEMSSYITGQVLTVDGGMVM